MKTFNSLRVLLSSILVLLAFLLILLGRGIKPLNSADSQFSFLDASRVSKRLAQQYMKTDHVFIPSSHKFLHVRYHFCASEFH